MKRISKLLLILLVLLISLSGCNLPIFEKVNTPLPENCTHADADDNGRCDVCEISVLVSIDFYAINDLHGKFRDTNTNCGVDELSTFLRRRSQEDDNAVFLSSGDMWQGSSESNLTKGLIITEWMNDLNFEAMTLGNHEYDWGEEYIVENDKIAEFPFLAINVFDRETNARVEYCDASVVIERDGIQIGIIGAMGDCYSSISGDKSEGFYIKTGSELTALVKAEAQKLRDGGVDYIVYSIHDGHGRSSNSNKDSISQGQLSAYYDISLSNGYVDLVFEGHTHQKYVLVDELGVHHLQNGGENKGISHVEVAVNSITGTAKTTTAQFISSSIYEKMSDDTIVKKLLEKFKDEIAIADVVLGKNDVKRRSDEIKRLVARLYYDYGMETWGEDYDIVLGGGFVSTRNPYDLAAGEVKYADVQSILPFDNQLVLCSIKGSDLKSKFFETDNSNYYIYYEAYGTEVKNNLDPNATYYLITDSYSSSYAPNRLTVVAQLENEIFARDLVANYIQNGGMTTGG